jgi:hypothetical protein
MCVAHHDPDEGKRHRQRRTTMDRSQQFVSKKARGRVRCVPPRGREWDGPLGECRQLCTNKIPTLSHHAPDGGKQHRQRPRRRFVRNDNVFKKFRGHVRSDPTWGRQWCYLATGSCSSDLVGIPTMDRLQAFLLVRCCEGLCLFTDVQACSAFQKDPASKDGKGTGAERFGHFRRTHRQRPSVNAATASSRQPFRHSPLLAY